MSSPRYIWWSYVRGMIRKYPDRVSCLAELKEQSAKVEISGLPKAPGKISRPTETAALRQLPPTEQKELEAVEAAIRETGKLSNGKTRLKLIDLVLWKQTHTIQGAAMKLYVSEKTAKRWHRAFLVTVAKNYGLLQDGPPEPKK